uniref:Uncharacterized protein n=1 Tax=Rhizophora mucronata TaxID=61149 RepID=A0A2P2NJS6_RHIMU
MMVACFLIFNEDGVIHTIQSCTCKAKTHHRQLTVTKRLTVILNQLL